MNQSPYNPANAPDPQEESGARQVAVRTPVTRPIVTYAIMAVTILVFILQEISSAVLGGDLPMQLGAMNSVVIAAGQVWRLFTPMLLHFGIAHVGINMYSLFILGPSLERFYGHWRFLALYVLAGIGGNLLSFYMHGANTVSAGASTAIFGLIAAEGVFVYLNRRLFGERARGMLSNVVFMIVLNLGFGVFSNFDNWGHIGGLLTGLAFAWFAGPQMDVEQTVTGYALVDRRTNNTVWLAAFVIAAVLVGLAFARIMRLA